jgi:hypothetical protein
MMPIVVQALIDLVSKSPCQDPPVTIRGAASRADSAEARRHRDKVEARMWPAAGTKEDQVREIVCLRSACPGLLHSHEVVCRLILAIEKDVPVTNAWDIRAATNVPARRSAVDASCRCAEKICYSLNAVHIWFAFCLQMSNMVCTRFAYGLLFVFTCQARFVCSLLMVCSQFTKSLPPQQKDLATC